MMTVATLNIRNDFTTAQLE